MLPKILRCKCRSFQMKDKTTAHLSQPLHALFYNPFDSLQCPECHAEQAPDHPLRKTTEMAFICKKCKRAFRKDLAEFEQGADEYCPHCDNLYVRIIVFTNTGRGYDSNL